MLSVEAAFYRTMYERFRDAFKNQNTESIGPSSALIREFRDCFERFAPENLEEHGWECRLPFSSLLSSNNPEFYDRRRKEIILSARDIQAFLDPVIDLAVSLISEQHHTVATAGFGGKKQARLSWSLGRKHNGDNRN